MASITREIENIQPIQQEKRKLALVKCERCRLDKQKGLPVDRVWPTKCSRCTERDFPCAEGKRVHRKTKHVVSTDAVQPSPNGIDEVQHLASSELKEMVKKRATLLSYQKLMDLAMRRLNDLKTESIKPILDQNNDGGSPCDQLGLFYDELETAISDLSRHFQNGIY
ncbi:hypothetical protein P280DRAFT_319731 [Massarina eburnea CBS 473.64]|uniref:Uncharacterized protein n=1 Tax=Massarina eburnea CBS 473.64 TaxID=1395130 RepID=A0A6A6RZC5_9PLEO|nr:hypothetical protein P280DRAFT_319731 [Massarina eburnea CBS 473.64]